MMMIVRNRGAKRSREINIIHAVGVAFCMGVAAVFFAVGFLLTKAFS